MKLKKIFTFAMITLTCSNVNGQELPQLGKSSLSDIIKSMTLEEKVNLLLGSSCTIESNQNATVGNQGLLVSGSAGETNAIPRLGIPATVLADGPAGVRINPIREDTAQTFYCTHFPVETLLASSWNTELVYQVGKAMGDEAKRYGIDVLLAPATNIHRNPLNGRNFEYYSEDPILSGEMASAMINGIQSNGVGTSLKHFALNNQETNRTNNNVIVYPRTLREIYLKPFEIAIKKSNPWTVMSSYNKINGTYASENTDLLTNILRKEWGFKGIVMTDWFGGEHSTCQMNAGNDLLMPGKKTQRDEILDAVKKGILSHEIIDRNVFRILKYITHTLRFKGYVATNDPDLKAHAQISRQTASEGMVLLKNNDQTLPFNERIKDIALFGCASYDFIAGGTGSGDVNSKYTISLSDGLRNAGLVLDDNLNSLYNKYIIEEESKLVQPKMFLLPRKRVSEMILDKNIIRDAALRNDMAIITIGKTSGEFLDRSIKSNFNLVKEEKELIESVCKIFHDEGKKVVVILNVCGVIETYSWRNLPDAILLAWMSGQEGGNSVADIIIGKVTPSGHLPMTFPIKYDDVPSKLDFPDIDNMSQDNLDEVLSNLNNVRTETYRKNLDVTTYNEGIFVGYRYYDSKNLVVAYPFGYGLSYTSFEYVEPKVSQESDSIIVSLKVKNTGKYVGKDVIQIYVTAPGKDMIKPKKELKAFHKTILLQPGETEDVVIKIAIEDLDSFNEKESQWQVEDGKYKIHIGSDCCDIKHTLSCYIKGRITEKVQPLMRPY